MGDDPDGGEHGVEHGPQGRAGRDGHGQGIDQGKELEQRHATDRQGQEYGEGGVAFLERAEPVERQTAEERRRQHGDRQHADQPTNSGRANQCVHRYLLGELPLMNWRHYREFFNSVNIPGCELSSAGSEWYTAEEYAWNRPGAAAVCC